jgi:hypothetical protein
MKAPKVGADDFAASGHAETDIAELPRADVAAGPECTRSADDFLFVWPDADVRIEVTTVKEHSEGITAELAVSLGGRELHWGRLALASTPARGQLVKRLAQQHRALPWGTLVEQACRGTVRAVRQGAPALQLTGAPFTGPRFLVEPFVWHTDCSFLFADGGSGKGWLALLTAITLATGQPIAGLRPVAGRRLSTLYLDWEASQADLDDRLHRLGRGLGFSTANLPIYRLAMDRPLAQDLVRVRAETVRCQAGLLIVDSWMPACGAGRDGAGFDTAVAAFAALRGLGRPALAIAHLSKTMADQKSAGRIYGSVFNGNLSRNVWEVKRSDDSDAGAMLLGCYHSKVNDVAKRKPFGVRVGFDGDAGPVTIAGCPLREGGPDLLAKLPLPARLLTALTSGALTAAALAEETGVSEDTVGRTLRRLGEQGKVVKVSETKPYTWGRAAS